MKPETALLHAALKHLAAMKEKYPHDWELGAAHELIRDALGTMGQPTVPQQPQPDPFSAFLSDLLINSAELARDLS
jgi:hypothetical protein